MVFAASEKCNVYKNPVQVTKGTILVPIFTNLHAYHIKQNHFKLLQSLPLPREWQRACGYHGNQHRLSHDITYEGFCSTSGLLLLWGYIYCSRIIAGHLHWYCSCLCPGSYHYIKLSAAIILTLRNEILCICLQCYSQQPVIVIVGRWCKLSIISMFMSSKFST